MASTPALIPRPVTAALSPSERLTLTKDVVIAVTPGQADLQRIARDLAELLRPALDATLTVRDTGSTSGVAIRLRGSLRLLARPSLPRSVCRRCIERHCR